MLSWTGGKVVVFISNPLMIYGYQFYILACLSIRRELVVAIFWQDSKLQG